MDEVVNFSAGPAMLPPSVISEIRDELGDWYHGMSILELSHRSKPVIELKNNIDKMLRELLDIPDDFTILMMHGGARGQFSAVPMNLLGNNNKASYLITGYWGDKAAKVCESLGQVERITPQVQDFPLAQLNVSAQSAYLHTTDNETIEGVELNDLPDVDKPIVSDMTSNLLSREINWQKTACVYASAQKNLGVAGCTYVILKRSLLQEAMATTPDILNYTISHESQSLYNTPSVFCWYVTDKILKWVQAQGGISMMAQRANQRSKMLYDFIDGSDLYENTVPASVRSKMNVPFSIKEHEKAFFEQSEKAQLYFLEGHRSVGGGRASMYNAMPIEGVEKLIDFMQSFETRMS